jgi:hypothetical protein
MRKFAPCPAAQDRARIATDCDLGRKKQCSFESKIIKASQCEIFRETKRSGLKIEVLAISRPFTALQIERLYLGKTPELAVLCRMSEGEQK